MIQVSDIISRCYSLFNERDPSLPIYLSREVLLSFVNWCNRVIAESTDGFVKYGTIMIEKEQPVYGLPQDLHRIKWAWYDGKSLEASSVRRWAERDPEWRKKVGTPTEYALDGSQRNRVYLHKNPAAAGGGGLIIKAYAKQVVSIENEPVFVSFYSMTEPFVVGSNVESGTGEGVVAAVECFGSSGRLFLADTNGTFTADELIECSDAGVGGSAKLLKTGLTTLDPEVAPFSFVTEGGSEITVSNMTGPVYSNTPVLGFEGLQDTAGQFLPAANGNLVLMYNYYPPDLEETHELPRPFNNAEEAYIAFVMTHMYLVESVQQDMGKVGIYISRFAALTGIDERKLWTPQRQFVQQSGAARRSSNLTLPEGY